MPVINPAELWQRSGRYGIDELFKFKDRRGADLVLAMTHEEVVTTHVAPAVRSYRDLPFSLYHFQTKGRDEPRPRAGVLRTREFIMKDAYTFDRDREGLDAHYERYREAYDRIFDRLGLEWYRVESDVGMMGGVGAHEYMAPCPAGENEVALAPGYAANTEVATADAQPVELPDGIDAPEEVQTPGLTTVAEVAQSLRVPPGSLLKAYPVIVEDRGLTIVVVRGDHRVNDIKLANALGAPFRPAREDEFAERIGPAGYIGPVGIDVPILLDDAVEPGAYVTGANRENAHLRGVEPGRDFPFKRGDVRRVEPGDTVDGKPIRIEPAIEVGNIFKLGTRFSEPLGATYLDESGKAAADLDGLVRDRPGADHRRRRRAVRRRARHLVAALDRAVRHPPRRPRQGGQRGARRGRAGVRRAAGDRPEDPLRRPRRRAGGEVRRRRAARRAAAPDGRAPHARERRRSRCRSGAGARRARSRWRAPRSRPRTCGGPFRNHRRARGRGGRARSADVPSPRRARPIGPATSRDAPRRAAAPVDDPERDRLRPARADPGVPGVRLLLRRRQGLAGGADLRHRRLERLLRRDRRPADRPVLAHGRAAGSARGPAAGALRRDRLLVLRPAPALGARAARRCARCS